MTWARLDDKFPDHKKVVGLSDPAFRLLVVMICDCANRETDGHIVKADVPRLVRGYQPKALAELIIAGNVHDGAEPFECDDERCRPEEDEVYVHGYLDCNPSHDKLEEDRAAAAARKAAWKAKRDAEAEQRKNAAKNGGGNGGRNGVPNTHPNPTQPNPAQPTGLGSGYEATLATQGGVASFDQALQAQSLDALREIRSKLKNDRAAS